MKKIIAVVTVACCVCAVIAQQQIDGFTNIGELNGHGYFVSQYGATWTVADSICEANGGYLACIGSQEENNLLVGYLQQYTYNAWIGFSDAETEGVWQWVSGEPVTYTNWNASQPDDYSGQDYVIVFPTDGWNDEDVEYFTYFALETETICPPTPLPFIDNFDSPDLDSCWYWIREDTSHWSLSERPGWMRITTQGGYIEVDSKNNLVRKRPVEDFVIETKVAFLPFQNYHEAGLILYDSPGSYVHFLSTFSSTKNLAFQGKDNYTLIVDNQVQFPDTVVYLRLEVANDTVEASWSSDGVNWNFYDQVVFSFVPSPNLQIGLFANNGGGDGYSAPEIPADFDYLRVYGNTQLQLSTPNGGEEWQILQTENVQWSGGLPEDLIRIELNRDYPAGAWELLADSTENDGEYEWFVTDPLSDNCRVRVSVVGDTISDVSDGDFSIVSSQGYLALVDPQDLSTPLIDWDAGVVECGMARTDSFRLKNFGSQSIVVFAPVALTGTDFSFTEDCPGFIALAPDEVSSCEIVLSCMPTQDGITWDTLRVQTDAVNQQDGYVRIPLVGEQVTTPAAPELVITIEGENSRISWEPVTESVGGCVIEVIRYLLFFSENSDGPYWYLGFTTDTTFVHAGAVSYAADMFYSAVSTTALPSTLIELPAEGVLTRREVMGRIGRET